jgi:hypothetical protein
MAKTSTRKKATRRQPSTRDGGTPAAGGGGGRPAAAARKASGPRKAANDATRGDDGGSGGTSGKGRLSALDAAARVLAESVEPMGARDLIKAMAERGLWASPAGKTPDATLYAAIIREIAKKGEASRFVKVRRGLFAAA